MESGSTYTYVCGRFFSQSGALAYHKRSCKLSKRRLNGALEKAKEVWDAKKKCRVEAAERRNSSHSEIGGVDTPTHVAGDATTSSEVENAMMTEVQISCKATHVCC